MGIGLDLKDQAERQEAGREGIGAGAIVAGLEFMERMTEGYGHDPRLGGAAAAMAGSVGDVTSDARGSGARFNAGKPAMELIPMAFLADYARGMDDEPLKHILLALAEFQRTGNPRDLFEEAMCWIWEPDILSAARVFDFGRRKYAEWNWAKGMPWSVPFGCIGRHALAILGGEKIDPESGETHMGHIVCNLVMLFHFVEFCPDLNDMPKELTLAFHAEVFADLEEAGNEGS